MQSEYAAIKSCTPSRTACSSILKAARVRGSYPSPPRTRGSRAANGSCRPWIPACAGMTSKELWLGSLPDGSGAGQGAVFFPEAADRRLAGPEILRLGVVAAHHHDATVVVIVLQRALHKAPDAAVFPRAFAGRADPI